MPRGSRPGVEGTNYRHGCSYHSEYQCWMDMMWRCFKAAKSYEDYGGRGITVCVEWRDPGVFLAYLDEVLGPRPEGHTLDRIDNDGDYEPGNVRWATPTEQAQNRRARRWAARSGTRSDNTSGVQGVYRNKQRWKPWKAKIVRGGKQIHVGFFDTVEEAEAAVIAKREEVLT